MTETSTDKRRRTLWESLDRATAAGSEDECWLWKGSTNTVHGYGYIHRRKDGEVRSTRVYRVHRLAYERANGVVLEPSDVIHHLCGNRSCVNPKHLHLTNFHDHMRDHHLPSKCKNGHSFTPENTKTCNGHRTCRTCSRAAARIRENKRWANDEEWRKKKSASNRARYHDVKGSQ